MTDIVKYEGDAQQLPATLDKAEQAIEIANNPAEINQVLAMMDAAVAFANRYYKGQRELIQRAKGLQARAERRLGELLQEMPKATGSLGQLSGRNSSGGTKTVPPEGNAPTLAEIGIDKKTSARAQKLAALPDDVFADVESGKVSVAKAIAPTERKKPTKRTIDAKPAEILDFSKDDELADAAHTITELSEENNRLSDQLAVASMDGSGEEKTQAAQIIAELRETIKVLEAENDALKVSRDTYMRESGEKQKQINFWRKKAEKVAA